MRTALAIAMLIGVIAVACGDDGGGGGAPPPVEGTSSLTDLGVGVIEIVTGVGPAITPGDLLEVHYTGWLTDGREFDSSLDREPFSFKLDTGAVIAGWDDGLAGMAVGGVRRLVIPPELAYGDRGREGIPPGSELVFDIELIGITPCQIPEESPPPVEGETFTTEGGVQVIVIEKGSEEDPTQLGDSVSMTYTGWLTANGSMFDSSHNRCVDFTFLLGSGQVIQGWDEGILGMSPGDVRRLIIPAELAYGEQGRTSIPANSSLTFDVELIAFGRQSGE
ncbi:MAG: FKBP-type peptidyl-prolyl cis-trans isomerase [Chloroflexi bacterium]|nr:FKBP-type peptidyl-prolyl cis-trans isomerase [Chloroflexota bacterium]